MNRFNKNSRFKLNSSRAIAVLVGTGVWGILLGLPSVHAELVYEGSGAEPNQLQSQVDDRAALRQTLGSSEKAQATLQAQQPVALKSAAAPAPLAGAASALAPQGVTLPPSSPSDPAPSSVSLSVSPAATPPETQNLSHAELLRRERMREELKNEDALQTRLEALRLRDEQRRTNQILAPSLGDTEASQSAPAVSGPAPAPMTEHPAGQSSVAAPLAPPVSAVAAQPSVVQPQVQAQAQALQVASMEGTSSLSGGAASGGAVGTSMVRSSEEAESSERSRLGLTAQGGLSNFNTHDNLYKISPQFSAGIGASYATSDYLSFQASYTYSQYGVSVQNLGYFSQNYPVFGSNSLQTLQYNQNVIDLGAKVSLLGPDSKIRPFVTGGFGYSKGYVNYNSTFVNYLQSVPGQSPDYDLNQYLGYLGAGMDFKLSRSISLGLEFRYYDVLSSSESGSLYDGAFYNGNPYGVYGDGMSNKQLVGGSLSSANFYSAMAGLTFNM